MSDSPLRARIMALVILVFGAFAGFFAVAEKIPGLSAAPGIGAIVRNYRLGLDLQGGTHLLYRADFSDFRGVSKGESMSSLRDAIERRVNLFGVTEPVVQVETSGDEYRLIVELAGVKDISQAIRLIGETPFLEFKEARTEAETKDILDKKSKGEETRTDPYFASIGLTGRFLERAELQFDSTTNAPLIGLEFDADGANLFEKMTEANIGKPLAIYLDHTPLSSPVVREKISGGKAQITGQFTIKEAQGLVRRLNSGALPVPITLVNQQSVEASLGAESLERSLKAALIGFAAVVLFMLLWYRLPGFVAVAALAVYASVVLSLFKLIPVTLSTAGIAGFILSIGMAVDANILIFERIKEELGAGRDLNEATIEGFRRAWTSIRDSNISSLITAVVLYWLGTSVVSGFTRR
ncbi:MAG: protein translocase subunit SecD [Candidatus Sungbacteria bacterium]|nr:protein translocase subunit SecD [Candidatus Sungbacteria bacterium]